MKAEQGRSAETIKQDHREKMEDKRRRRERWHRQVNAKPHDVRANLSRKHPDRGLSPAEHAARKAKRNL